MMVIRDVLSSPRIFGLSFFLSEFAWTFMVRMQMAL